MERLPAPPDGVVTRWGYWFEIAMWIMPSTMRYERIIVFLLHTWLIVQSDKGLWAADATDSTIDSSVEEHATSMAELVVKIKDAAKRECLQEAIDPTNRVWLCVVEMYGKSLINFIRYTEDDGAGVIFRVHRVLRERLAYLEDLKHATLKHADLEPLQDLLRAHPQMYSAEGILKIVHGVASRAHKYFQKKSSFMFENPALLCWGMMDDKGHAVQAAKQLIELADIQDGAGLADAMLRFLPEGATAHQIDHAIKEATDGIGLVFQGNMLDQARLLAGASKRTAKLCNLDGARELHDLLYRLGRYIAISNFIAETTVKDFGRLHPLQRLVSGRGIYAAKLVAGRRRTHPLPILTAADYTLASIELGTNKEDRRKDPLPAGPSLEIPDLDGQMADFVLAKDDEAGDSDDDMESVMWAAGQAGQHAGKEYVQVQRSKKAIRAALQVGKIIEVEVETTAAGEALVDLAMVMELPDKKSVKVRWLRETEEDDVFEIDEGRPIMSVFFGMIYAAISPVTEHGEGNSRRWHRTPSKAPIAQNSGSEPRSDSKKVEPQLDAKTKPVQVAAMCRATDGPTKGATYQSSSQILTETEWLGDQHLSGADAADDAPSGVQVTYNYPRPVALMPQLFGECTPKRLLREGTSSLVQQYCTGCHWLTIAIFGPKRELYFFDPLGNALTRRNPVRLAFMDAAGHGWAVVAIAGLFQTDNYQCGVWAHWFRTRFYAYLAHIAEHSDAPPFPEFLAPMPTELNGLAPCDLRALRPADARAGRLNNTTFSARLRKRMCGLLKAADQDSLGTVPIAQLCEFGGTTPTDFSALDAFGSRNCPIVAE